MQHNTQISEYARETTSQSWDKESVSKPEVKCVSVVLLDWVSKSQTDNSRINISYNTFRLGIFELGNTDDLFLAFLDLIVECRVIVPAGVKTFSSIRISRNSFILSKFFFIR